MIKLTAITLPPKKKPDKETNHYRTQFGQDSKKPTFYIARDRMSWYFFSKAAQIQNKSHKNDHNL